MKEFTDGADYTPLRLYTSFGTDTSLITSERNFLITPRLQRGTPMAETWLRVGFVRAADRDSCNDSPHSQPKDTQRNDSYKHPAARVSSNSYSMF